MTGNSIRKAIAHFCRAETDLTVFDLWIAPEEMEGEEIFPYISIGNGKESIEYAKTAGGGSEYRLTLHFWYNRPFEDQPEMIRAMDKVLGICQCLQVNGQYIRLAKSEAYQFYDTTSATPYLHGVLDLTFRY